MSPMAARLRSSGHTCWYVGEEENALGVLLLQRGGDVGVARCFRLSAHRRVKVRREPLRRNSTTLLQITAPQQPSSMPGF